MEKTRHCCLFSQLTLILIPFPSRRIGKPVEITRGLPLFVLSSCRYDCGCWGGRGGICGWVLPLVCDAFGVFGVIDAEGCVSLGASEGRGCVKEGSSDLGV